MSKYSDKINKIYDHVSDIRVNVASINQHLNTLNGKVANHRERIEALESDSIRNKINWAKLMGVAITISAIGGVVSGLVIKFFLNG